MSSLEKNIFWIDWKNTNVIFKISKCIWIIQDQRIFSGQITYQAWKNNLFKAKVNSRTLYRIESKIQLLFFFET